MTKLHDFPVPVFGNETEKYYLFLSYFGTGDLFSENVLPGKLVLRI
jgi:hypothetical protein